MKRTHIIFILIFCLHSFIPETVYSQDINIGAEIRPRFEFRNGYKKLMPNGADPASFISQRTRLNAIYKSSSFNAKLSLQDVRVWGDVAQLNKGDVYGTSIHEAWGEIIFSSRFSVKVGRQEIVYDDQRIFGSVGWAQQARSHDAAILKYKPKNNHEFNVGVAYNSNGESLFKTDYTINSYKAFQYIWYHGKFNKASASFLALNNGMAYTHTNAGDTTQKTAYSQTIGPRITYGSNKINIDATVYYQGGKNKFNNKLSAIYFSANVHYAVSKGFKAGIGGEYLSGTSTKDQNSTSYTDKSFKPFYGTNHKFNGWMDYFYVGSYMYNNGLIDINLPLSVKFNKFTLQLIPHYFMAAATVSQKQDDGSWKDLSSSLGTEVDFTAVYTMSPSVVISAGYSQMFATETMQILKGGNYKNTNNWAWLMLTFKPTFFKSNNN